MLCRVILGNMETVCRGSQQFHPGSKEYDSGVDDPSAPRRYTIWSAFMNSHILPSYIISFRVLLGKFQFRTSTFFLLYFESKFYVLTFLLGPCIFNWLGPQSTHPILLKPTSPWMRFGILLTELARVLPPHKMTQISKHHSDFCVSTTYNFKAGNSFT